MLKLHTYPICIFQNLLNNNFGEMNNNIFFSKLKLMRILEDDLQKIQSYTQEKLIILNNEIV